MNRRAFLRSAVATAVAAQFPAAHCAPPAELWGPEEWFAFLGAAFASPDTTWHEPVHRGELGTVDCGLRFIGMDLTSEPDRTVHVQKLPGGGWAMVVPSDTGVDWERALRGEG